MARILGIDAGDVRTGVALSDPGEFMASGLCTLTEYSEERLIDRLCALIALHNAEKVVLGLPVNMDGTKGFRAEKVEAFAAKLQEACRKEVILYDERCSTMMAHKRWIRSLPKSFCRTIWTKNETENKKAGILEHGKRKNRPSVFDSAGGGSMGKDHRTAGISGKTDLSMDV